MNEKLKLTSSYIFLCLVWGSTWLTIKISLESFPPFYSVSLRFLVASVFIYLWMKYSSIKLQTGKREMVLYFIMGIFSFVIPFALIYWSEQYIPSGLASVLFAVYPFFVALFSRVLIPNEKIEPVKLIGMLIGFTGIIIIFKSDIHIASGNYLLGMAAVIAGAIIQSFVFIIVKKYGHDLNPISMNLFPTILGGIFLFALSFITENSEQINYSLKGILAVLYLGIFASAFTFSIYYWLLKKIDVILLSFVAFITPVSAIVLGIIFYDENLTMNQLIGSAFVLIGLVITNLVFIKKKNKLSE